MVYSITGYKTLSVTQLVNVFVVMIHNLGSYDAFRLLCGYLFLEAKQDATRRSLKKLGRPVGTWAGPSVSELRSILGGRKGIRQQWQILQDAGLISRVGNSITITETPLPEAKPFLGLICGLDDFGGFRRSIVRAVPIRHEWFLEWAKPARSKLVPLLHLFYCAACLSFKNKKSGEVKNAATFKFEQLIHFSGLNRSRLTSARKQLIVQGRITPDSTLYQRKLNRDGHYAAIVLDWSRKLKQQEPAEIGRPPKTKRSETGRPYRDLKQASLVDRNQKGAGVFSKPKSQEPNPQNVQLSDLWNCQRLEQLFQKQKWLERTQPNFLFFVSAAVKSRSSGEKPGGLFAWLIRSNRKDFISQAHEDTALIEIRTFEESRKIKPALNEERRVGKKLQVAPEGVITTEERLKVRRSILEELKNLESSQAA